MGLENWVFMFVELDSMKVLIKKSMIEGVFGIFIGLKYLFGIYVKLDEVVVLL